MNILFSQHSETESLFNVKQLFIFLNSSVSFAYIYIFVFVKEIYIVANIIRFNFLEEDRRSLAQTTKDSGPRWEPCGTPHVVFRKSLLVSIAIGMYCFLLIK